MEKGFFGSREFVVSLVLALAVVAGGAIAIGTGFRGGGSVEYASCDRPLLPGAELPVAAPEVESSRTLRTVRYVLDAAGREGGAVAACAHFGDVRIGLSPDDKVRVTFTIASDGMSDILDRAEVRLAVHDQGAGLGVGAWVAREGGISRFGSTSVAYADVEILLPATGAYEVDAETEHGLVALDGLMTRGARLVSSFGDVEVAGVDAGGNLTASSEHGEVRVALAGVHTSAVHVVSRFGSVTARLPARADVGYNVTAATSFGDVDVQVGPVESYDTDDEGMGGRVHVRTVGYDGKPTQVEVLAESDHGDVVVTAVATGG